MILSRAFGLDIESDAPIPGLRTTTRSLPTSEPPLRVHFDASPPALGDAVDQGTPWPNARADQHPHRQTRSLQGGRWISVTFGNEVRFFVARTADEVWFRRPGFVTIEEVATYLVGPIFGLVLRLRGSLCLHASAAMIGDGAIAIVGAAESGKSTTAAALLRRGIPILSDDITVVDINDRACARPGFPRLRMWPDTSAAILGPDVQLEALCPDWDKRYYDLEAETEFVPTSQPLTRLYLLGERDAGTSAPAIERLPASDAMLALVANSYANRFLDAAMRAQEFASLTALIRLVPTFQLTRRAGFAHLDELCDLLIAHATAAV